MGSTGNEIHFLVYCAGCFAEAFLGHVECIGMAADHHQQRNIDKVHIFARVKIHQLYKAALCVLKTRIGMCVSLQIILISLAV